MSLLKQPRTQRKRRKRCKRRKGKWSVFSAELAFRPAIAGYSRRQKAFAPFAPFALKFRSFLQ